MKLVMRIIIEVDRETIDRIVSRMPREWPRKRWTDRERKKMFREWLAHKLEIES